MTPTPFVFGKVPGRGDFVRAGQAGLLLTEVDGWLQRAILTYRRPLPDGPALGLAWGRPAGTLLCALRPSRDRAGRSFPLLAGAAAGPGRADVVERHAPLFRTALDRGAEVVAGERSPEDVLPDLDAAGADGSGDFLSAAPADAFGDAPLGDVLTRMGHVLGPVGRGGPVPRYGLGMPLPADPAARPAAAAFWLAAAGRLAGPTAPWTLLWTADGARARLALFLGTPAPDVLGYLLDGAAVDGVYDLDAEPAVAARADGAPSLRALLDRL